MRNDITQEYLKTIISYDPETGEFTWIIGRNNRAMPGAKAGCLRQTDGYRTIKIGKKSYNEHRLAWLYMTGEWPKKIIDHIDGNRSNNEFKNLRQANFSQNCAHRIYEDRNLGRGVRLNKPSRTSPYWSTISHDNKHIYLGSFMTPDEAAHAYNKAAINLHGEFAILNPIGEDKPASTPTTLTEKKE